MLIVSAKKPGWKKIRFELARNKFSALPHHASSTDN